MERVRERRRGKRRRDKCENKYLSMSSANPPFKMILFPLSFSSPFLFFSLSHNPGNNTTKTSVTGQCCRHTFLKNRRARISQSNSSPLSSLFFLSLSVLERIGKIGVLGGGVGPRGVLGRRERRSSERRFS